MIKKLQRKFILLFALSLLLVMAVLIASINIVNYMNVVDNADEVLGLLSGNEGRFPMMDAPGNNRFPPGMSPETPYATRYFSVLLTRDGKVIQTETGSIAAIGTREAIQIAQQVTGDRGFYENYRYLRAHSRMGERLIFLDCESELSAFRSFLLVSCGISLVAWCILSLVIAFLSARILRPIAESYEKQKQFITDASHELKTPLTIIHADADVLEMEVGESDWLSDIRRQAMRMGDLTRDLTSLARMDEVQPLSLISLPLSDIVSEAAASFSAPAQTKGQQLQLQIQPTLSIKGDEASLTRLVSILLDNAIKYAPEGADIRLVLEKQGKNLRLCIENPTSAAIAKEDLDRLFERFYRPDPSRNSQTGGHGLGLSLAKAIVQTHGGKISAATEGTALKITAVFPS